MAYRARSPVSIEHAPQWLAIIRIGVGLYFVKSLVTKMSIVLLGGFLPFPAVSDRWINVMPTIVTKQASDNPILFYKHFLENTVLTHVNLFAHLTAWGETVVGLGLTLGFLTGLSSIVGPLLMTQLFQGFSASAPGMPFFAATALSIVALLVLLAPGAARES